jgi:aspartate racemase
MTVRDIVPGQPGIPHDAHNDTLGASRQQLVPGLVGMSVHTDCVYLREINAADPRNASEPQVSNTNMVLHAINFEYLIGTVAAHRPNDTQALLRDAVTTLQQASVDFLVVTANTLHTALDDIQDAIKVPVLDITRAVLVHAREQGFASLGLLSTRQTLASGIYERTAEDLSISIVRPSAQIAQDIETAILRRLIRGLINERDVALVLDAISWFADNGADAVILGCTDLTLLSEGLGDVPLPLLDSTVLHARAARRPNPELLRRLLHPRWDVAAGVEHTPHVDMVLALDVEDQVRESSQRPGT